MTNAIDRIEALYDLRHGFGGTTKDYKPIAQKDVDLLGKHTDLSVAKACDVGCGGGAHLRALVETGARFPVGIDLSGRALSALLQGKDSSRLLLVRGDVTLWQQYNVFGAVICSLPPLDHEGRMCLQAFIVTLYKLLNRGGVLLLKIFTLESVPSIVGRYAVNYDGATCETCSEVTYDEYRRTMKIVQYHSDTPNEIITEELALPSSEGVFAALDRAGFVIEHVINGRTSLLPGTQTFIARA